MLYRPIIWLLVGAVLIPLALVVSLTWLPSSIAEAQAYGAAGACKEPILNGSGCWTEISAVETGTEIVPHKRSAEYYVHLQDDFGQQRVLVFYRRAFDQLRPGQLVSARFWNGYVALIHVPGQDDLVSEDEPGTTVGYALLLALFTLLIGAIFFLGGLGVHREYGSWTRSVPGEDFGSDMFDAVPPPARPWVAGLVGIGLVTIVGALIAHLIFGAPLVPAILLCAGLGALLWAWALFHRVRSIAQRRSLPRKPR
jgi:hypothetical protein